LLITGETCENESDPPFDYHVADVIVDFSENFLQGFIPRNNKCGVMQFKVTVPLKKKIPVPFQII
jgi:hypothetical protein